MDGVILPTDVRQVDSKEGLLDKNRSCTIASLQRPTLDCRLTIVVGESYAPTNLGILMHASENEDLAHRLATSGLRMTRQRQQVFDVVADSHDRAPLLVVDRGIKLSSMSF